MTTLAALFVAVGLGVVGMAVIRTRLNLAGHPTPVDIALGLVEAPERSAVSDASLFYRAAEPMMRVAADIGHRLLPSARVERIRARLVYAGVDGQVAVERVLAYQVGSALLAIGLVVLATPGVLPMPLWVVFAGAAGSFVPDMLLRAKADARQKEIRRDLPEALDLLAITVEAGLGLEQALDVVTANLTGPLGGELVRVLREIELGVPRHDALVALRARTDVPELSGFVVALIQADQLGGAVADVLKVQAGQVRLKRFQRAREQAAKAPVKILFPLIFGILPSIFVVTIGPGVISISGSLFKQ